MKFKTIDDIAKFVLEVCAHMKYVYLNINNELEITKNFDMKYVYLFDSLMKEHFDKSLKTLRINEDITEIEEGYLENMDLEALVVFYEIKKLPKLPESLVKICNVYDTWSHIKFTNRNSDIRLIDMVGLNKYYVKIHLDTPVFISGNSKRELLDKISSGEIIV